MTTDEIVKALRWLAKETEFTFAAENLNGAAALIESMQAQLADYHHTSELVDGKMEENQRLRRINENLQSKLAASQRREQAAVENMKIIADTYREKNCDDGICGLCKFDADHGLDGYANECPGFETDDCFEWRDPQEAER